MTLAIGALDVSAHAAHARPVVAEAASELAEQGVVLDRAVDAVEVVGHRGQIAGAELRAQRAGVEQGRRAAHEVERRQQLVELDGALLAVDLVDGQPHRDAHEEGLRQLEADAAGGMDEVAVVEGLQAQIGELQVALGPQGRAEAGQVEAAELLVEQFQVAGAFDIGAEVVRVAVLHVGLGLDADRHVQQAQRLAPHDVEQQPGGGLAVGGFALDHGAGGHDQRLADVGLFDAVEQVAQAVFEDGLGVDAVEIAGGLVHQPSQALGVQRTGAAVGERDIEAVLFDRRRGGGLLGALAGAGLAVEHVVARDLVLPGAHQRQLHLILYVFDMHGAAAGQASGQGRGHLFGEILNLVMDAAGRGGIAALDGQEGLGHRDLDLVRVEVGDLAVAADDLDLARLMGGDVGCWSLRGTRLDRPGAGRPVAWRLGGRRFLNAGRCGHVVAPLYFRVSGGHVRVVHRNRMAERHGRNRQGGANGIYTLPTHCQPLHLVPKLVGIPCIACA